VHIPDGYLSPSTCAVLYAASAPFWAAAIRRVRDLFSDRYVPLISLSAAFSFVIMMFNLPLPGGTTGHAIGVSIAAITLGPWGAMLAVSVALGIQALLFGDGGILALGANCFNIAIAGSIVAHLVYRLLSGRAEIGARRRVFAAAAAGYLAINVAAVLTALELGIQPALFRDASGMPLYAPYPVGIALPAMMLGHITFAGFAEAILSAGIVAWLQKARPSLLRTARSDSLDRVSAWRTLRPLWIGLAALLVLTPLGLIATATAWGEWGVEDFLHPGARQEIAAASLDAPLPEKVPEGLRRWSSLWSAPIPDYAPAALRSERAGYALSGMLGVGIILSLSLLLEGLFARLRNPVS
jgi:cobalt/nickel transport system permease protein